MSRFIGVDEKPAPLFLILYGFQHMLAMFAGIVAVPLMVGTALKLPGNEMTILVQGSLLTSGIGTLVQCLGIGRLGARLPICMGTAFVFMSPLISIGSRLGVPAIMGAAIVGGVVEYIFSFFVWKVKDLVPPVVTGTVVVLIGLGLMPLGFSWLAGLGGPLSGQPINFIVGGLVLLILLGVNQYTKGFLPSIAVAVAIVVGYIIAWIAGMLDLSLVKDAAWVSVPKIFYFGLPKFSFPAILAMLVAQFASMLETVGDTFATGVVSRKEIGKRELSGAISVDGLMSSVATFFNGFPITSFSQNIGVIGITGVASRFAVAGCGIILLLLGFIPKFAAIVAGMPAPVLGGAALVMFGSIAGSGIIQFRETKTFTQREILIFATAVALGLGFGLHPAGALDALPPALATILESGVAVGGITAIVLNRILPKHEQDATK